MSNAVECYYNGGMWDGKFIPTNSGAMQEFARKTIYSEKKVIVHRYERVDSKEMQFKEETTEPMKDLVFRPRNELVIVRVETIDKNRAGIALPGTSLESKKYIVTSVGPKVEDLKVGDRVLINGEKGQEWQNIPGYNDLIVTHQQFVSLIIEEVA